MKKVILAELYIIQSIVNNTLRKLFRRFFGLLDSAVVLTK